MSVTPPRRIWVGPVLEAVVAGGTAALFVASCLFIKVTPLERIGQISGLASLAFRFVLFGLALVVALVLAARVREGRHFALTSRLACAALAGLASGIVAGGVLFALRGTPWGLNGKGGDAAALASWATALHRGEDIPPTYPPLALHILHLYSDLSNLAPEFALKHLQLFGIAACGPVAYLSWRLVLRPPWALVIGVISMIPLIEPYKPFPNLVLIVFVPVAILFLDWLREIPARGGREIARAGVGFGAVFGLMFLTYSGWFQWAAPGLVVATAVVFPWRTAPRKGIYLLALTGVVFLLLTGSYLHGLLFDPAGKIADSYIYFDVKVDPMFVAMWRNDTPGVIGTWPPIGELGGVGLFTLLLALGFGGAIAMGRKTTTVLVVGSMMTGAWIMRFMIARLMWDTNLVQLYPRTTPFILYCLMVLTGFAVYRLVQRLAADHPLRGRSGLIGAICALLLVFGSTGSAISDRYMPLNSDPPGPGWLTYNAYLAKWGEKPNYKSLPLKWVRRSIVPVDSAPHD